LRLLNGLFITVGHLNLYLIHTSENHAILSIPVGNKSNRHSPNFHAKSRVKTQNRFGNQIGLDSTGKTAKPFFVVLSVVAQSAQGAWGSKPAWREDQVDYGMPGSVFILLCLFLSLFAVPINSQYFPEARNLLVLSIFHIEILFGVNINISCLNPNMT